MIVRLVELRFLFGEVELESVAFALGARQVKLKPAADIFELVELNLGLGAALGW